MKTFIIVVLSVIAGEYLYGKFVFGKSEDQLSRKEAQRRAAQIFDLRSDLVNTLSGTSGMADSKLTAHYDRITRYIDELEK